MLPIIDAIRQRVLARSAARAGAFLPRIRPQPLKYTQSTGRTQNMRKTPLFGAGEGFGLDWAQTRSIQVPSQGHREDVASPIVNNVQGRVGHWSPNPELGTPYQDPALSRTGKKTYEGTDQSPLKRGGSPVTRWDGEVRNLGRRAGFERSRGPKELTPGDKIAASWKDEPYDFRG